jgi:hypothetical protein
MMIPPIAVPTATPGGLPGDGSPSEAFALIMSATMTGLTPPVSSDGPAVAAEGLAAAAAEARPAFIPAPRVPMGLGEAVVRAAGSPAEPVGAEVAPTVAAVGAAAPIDAGAEAPVAALPIDREPTPSQGLVRPAMTSATSQIVPVLAQAGAVPTVAPSDDGEVDEAAEPQGGGAVTPDVPVTVATGAVVPQIPTVPSQPAQGTAPQTHHFVTGATRVPAEPAPHRQEPEAMPAPAGKPAPENGTAPGTVLEDHAGQPVTAHPSGGHVDAAHPTPVQAASDLPHREGPSTEMVRRVEDAVRRIEQAPPPRAITLTFDEGTRVTVSIHTDGVRLSIPEGASTPPALVSDLEQALAGRGFSMADGGAGHRRREPEPEAPIPIPTPSSTKPAQPDQGLRL